MSARELFSLHNPHFRVAVGVPTPHPPADFRYN